MDSKEFKTIVHGMRAEAAKRMREKHRPWGNQGNNTMQGYRSKKHVFRPKLIAIILISITWLLIIGMVVLAICM
ncbi:MAG: hypothetical protein PHV93_04630 [Candidatus Pacebacteria bacterium]|nr:hypothetical protein [Candidatus Paceibacterota bacterium]